MEIVLISSEGISFTFSDRILELSNFLAGKLFI